MRALFVCLFGILFATTADAATGDTFITVTYRVATVRIKPQPGTGVGDAKLRMVLHANGTVDEVMEAQGKYPKKFENKNKLGTPKGAVHYRVLDKNTIERIAPGKTFVTSVKVVVDGPSCKADVAYTLKPGEKEMVIFSTGLGVMTYYSELKPFDVQCKIE